MKKLYLHIGTPKTGTTAIQSFLYRNRTTLLHNGISYPVMKAEDNMGIGTFAQAGNIADAFLGSTRIDTIAHNLAMMVGAEDITILSSEVMWVAHYDRLPMLLNSLKKEIGAATELYVVLYVRSQPEYLESLYREAVQGGDVRATPYETAEFFIGEEPWEKFDSDYYYSLQRIREQADYYSVITKVADEVSRDHLLIRNYDSVRNAGIDVVDDFLSLLSVNIKGYLVREKDYANPSIGYGLLEAKRIINCWSDQYGVIDINDLFMRDLRMYHVDASKSERKHLFTFSQRKRLFKKYKEGNEKLGKEFMGTDVLFQEPQPAFDEELDWTTYLEESVRMLSGAVLQLNQKIRDIEMKGTGRKKTMKILDIEVCRDIGFLLDKKNEIWIYGAGVRGNEMYEMFSAAGRYDVMFIDMDFRKWNKIIYSPTKFAKAIEGHDNKVCIALCIENPMDAKKVIEDVLSTSNEEVNVVSYFALRNAFYIHRKGLFANNKKILSEYNMKNVIRENELYINRISHAIEQMTFPDNTVWLYQSGKVGSMTLANRLNHSHIPFLHQHTLDFYAEFFDDKYKEDWENARVFFTGKKRKVISMVREPLERDYSAFWQAYTEGVDLAWRMPFFCGDFDEMYRMFVHCLREGTQKTRELLGTSFVETWRDEFLWYDEEFKKYLGIDIYSYPFDREAGYTIIEEGNYSVFLYKLECFDKILPKLAEFLEVENLDGENDNEAIRKTYSITYQEFLKTVKFPKEYVDYYYLGNMRMDHFYTEQEKKTFLEKWKNNIV